MLTKRYGGAKSFVTFFSVRTFNDRRRNIRIKVEGYKWQVWVEVGDSVSAVCGYLAVAWQDSMSAARAYLAVAWHTEVKGKAIPLQAWTAPEGSRSLRLPDFKIIGTWSW